MRADSVRSIDLLPPGARSLLGSGDFFSTEAWLRLVCEHALPPDARPELLVCGEPGTPACVLPLLVSSGRLGSLTTPYTSGYSALGRPGMSNADWRAAGMAAGQYMRAWPSIRLDALDMSDPALPGLIEGFRRAGLFIRRFEHFGNWHEHVAGLEWPKYLAARPGDLRETLRRKGRRAGLSFEMVKGGAKLGDGIAAYDRVYRRSWKEPEPFPDFPAGLIRIAADTGSLRLGLCWKEGAPVAAQIWVVHARQASIHKLAHDEAAKADSPGTLLTAFILRTLLDDEVIDEIDFGRGDDPYKRRWASTRRQRIGLLAINPRHIVGAALLMREAFGEVRKRVLAVASRVARRIH